MDSHPPFGILGVMNNPDALPRNKQTILARWAALYPEAFALASAANTNTGLLLRRLNQARPNLADLITPPSAVPPFHNNRFELSPQRHPATAEPRPLPGRDLPALQTNAFESNRMNGA